MSEMRYIITTKSGCVLEATTSNDLLFVLKNDGFLSVFDEKGVGFYIEGENISHIFVKEV